MAASSLNSGDCFVLSLMNEYCIVWLGSGSSAEEQATASTVAAFVNPVVRCCWPSLVVVLRCAWAPGLLRRHVWGGAVPCVRLQEPVVYTEGAEDEGFWDAIGGKSACLDAWRKEPGLPPSMPRPSPLPVTGANPGRLPKPVPPSGSVFVSMLQPSTPRSL